MMDPGHECVTFRHTGTANFSLFVQREFTATNNLGELGMQEARPQDVLAHDGRYLIPHPHGER